MMLGEQAEAGAFGSMCLPEDASPGDRGLWAGRGFLSLSARSMGFFGLGALRMTRAMNGDTGPAGT
jgi:hypothetical protein